MKIEDFPFQVKEKYKFFKVNKNNIYYTKNGDYYFAGTMYESLTEDINQDGNEEIVSRESSECFCMCSSPPASIKIWNGTEIKEIYNQYGNVSLDFKDKLVIETLTQYDGDQYSSDPNRIPKVTTNYYELKNFELVSTQKRPKKS